MLAFAAERAIKRILGIAAAVADFAHRSFLSIDRNEPWAFISIVSSGSDPVLEEKRASRRSRQQQIRATRRLGPVVSGFLSPYGSPTEGAIWRLLQKLHRRTNEK
jgi:hypothetical protein